MPNSTIVVNDRFENFVNDNMYRTYFSIGSYASGKSHDAGASKLILMLFEEKRLGLVVRATYKSLKESCYSVIKEILTELDLLELDTRKRKSNKVIYREHILEFLFPNGSRILFMGTDKPERLKSMNGVSVVWLEELPEIKYEAYKEIRLRARCKDRSVHFIITCNPIDMQSWVYKEFFVDIDKHGNEIVKVDHKELYEKRDIIYNNTWYHHSTIEDNEYATPDMYERLDETKESDPDLWRIARLGQFGPKGTIVLPQFEISKNPEQTLQEIKALPMKQHFIGFDFGYETSYNAVVRMAVDMEKQYLYLYDEIYENKVTDDIFAARPDMQDLKHELEMKRRNKVLVNPIVGDSASPEKIQYYKQQGFPIRACKNRGMGEGRKGTRLSNTQKIKRFKKIICLPTLKNIIRECQFLTYLTDRNGIIHYDQFTIDPHTFSGIWYGLDNYHVADLKNLNETRNSWISA